MSDKLVNLFMFYPLLLLSLSVHESAHAWSADKLGDTTAKKLGRVSLNPIRHIDFVGTVFLPILAILSGTPLIGWGKPVPVDFRNLKKPLQDNIWIAAAGPASNLVLAIFFATGIHLIEAYASSFPHFREGATQVSILTIFYLIFRMGVVLNLVLAFFNLIPIFPLDGGNIIRGILPKKMLKIYDKIFARYGMFLLLLLFFSGFLRYVFAPVDWMTKFLLP